MDDAVGVSPVAFRTPSGSPPSGAPRAAHVVRASPSADGGDTEPASDSDTDRIARDGSCDERASETRRALQELREQARRLRAAQPEQGERRHEVPDATTPSESSASAASTELERENAELRRALLWYEARERHARKHAAPWRRHERDAARDHCDTGSETPLSESECASPRTAERDELDHSVASVASASESLLSTVTSLEQSMEEALTEAPQSAWLEALFARIGQVRNGLHELVGSQDELIAALKQAALGAPGAPPRREEQQPRQVDAVPAELTAVTNHIMYLRTLWQHELRNNQRLRALFAGNCEASDELKQRVAESERRVRETQSALQRAEARLQRDRSASRQVHAEWMSQVSHLFALVLAHRPEWADDLRRAGKQSLPLADVVDGTEAFLRQTCDENDELLVALEQLGAERDALVPRYEQLLAERRWLLWMASLGAPLPYGCSASATAATATAKARARRRLRGAVRAVIAAKRLDKATSERGREGRAAAARAPPAAYASPPPLGAHPLAGMREALRVRDAQVAQLADTLESTCSRMDRAASAERERARAQREKLEARAHKHRTRAQQLRDQVESVQRGAARTERAYRLALQRIALRAAQQSETADGGGEASVSMPMSSMMMMKDVSALGAEVVSPLGVTAAQRAVAAEDGGGGKEEEEEEEKREKAKTDATRSHGDDGDGGDKHRGVARQRRSKHAHGRRRAPGEAVDGENADPNARRCASTHDAQQPSQRRRQQRQSWRDEHDHERNDVWNDNDITTATMRRRHQDVLLSLDALVERGEHGMEAEAHETRTYLNGLRAARSCIASSDV